MTDFKKFKNAKPKARPGLGTPPKANEVKDNLSKPETAPGQEKKGRGVGRPSSSRTEKLTTTLTPEFKKRLKLLSVNHDKDMGEIIEEAVKFWEKSL